jgi:hypothetical protein
VSDSFFDPEFPDDGYSCAADIDALTVGPKRWGAFQEGDVRFFLGWEGREKEEGGEGWAGDGCACY